MTSIEVPVTLEAPPAPKIAKRKVKAAEKAEKVHKKIAKSKSKEKVSADVAVVESGKTKQKKRVKKDKNAPKKPMSPFFCYQAVRRATLKAEQPTLNNTDIIKAMTAEWHLLSEEAKEPHRK